MTGRVSIDWGIYGVPETYVVNAEGRISALQRSQKLPFVQSAAKGRVAAARSTAIG